MEDANAKFYRAFRDRDMKVRGMQHMQLSPAGKAGRSCVLDMDASSSATS